MSLFGDQTPGYATLSPSNFQNKERRWYRHPLVTGIIACAALLCGFWLGSFLNASTNNEKIPAALQRGSLSDENQELSFNADGIDGSFRGIAARVESVRDGYMPDEELYPMEALESGGRLLLHTWHEGFLFAGYELLISSALVTQDLERTKLIIWMDQPWLEAQDDRKREIVKKFRYTPYGFVEFRLMSSTDLASMSTSCWKDRPEFMLKYPFISFSSIAFYSDVVRLLLLNVYGGVWVDSDTTFLVDLQVLHRKAHKRVVSGRNFRETDHMGNNNFLYVTDKQQRELIGDISCEFRFKPLMIPRLNYTMEELKTINFRTEWGLVKEVPKLADGSDVVSYNGWLWNDGVMKVCYDLKGLCHHYPLPLGKTDAVWFGVGGLMDFCETIVGYYGFYVPSVEQAIKSSRADVRNITSYWNAVGLDELTWVTHDRKNDCRTFGASVQGTLQVFEQLINLRLGKDPRFAPVEPLDFLYADPWLLHSRHLHEAEYAKLTILVQSHHSNIKQRRLVRSLANSFLSWLPKSDSEARRGPSFSVRVRFVIEIPDVPADLLPKEADRIRREIGHLMAESAQSGDVLLVPPSNRTSIPQSRMLDDNEKTSLPETAIPVGGNAGTLMYPNLTLYQRWGKEGLFNPAELELDIPEVDQPNLDLDEQDIEELTYSNWGERQFKGDGFVSLSMEYALMKWSLTSESLFMLLLNDDNIFFNIPKVIDIITNITAAKIFDKTATIPSFVVALPTEDINPQQHPKWDASSQVKKGFRSKYRYALPIDALLEKYDVMVSNDTLRDPNAFSGMLVTRDVLPYLLSSDNPIKRSSQVMFETCLDNSTSSTMSFANKMAAAYIPTQTTYSYSASRNLHTCLDGRQHPLNSRISFNKRAIVSQEAFMSRQQPNHIRILTPDNFGFVSMSFSQSLATSLSTTATQSVEIRDCLRQWTNTIKDGPSEPLLDDPSVRDLVGRAVVVSSLPQSCPEVVRPIELIAQGYFR